MYEMLTGRVPFDADTPVSIALKHMQEKPIEPIKLNPAVPFAVNQIIKSNAKRSKLKILISHRDAKRSRTCIKEPRWQYRS